MTVIREFISDFTKIRRTPVILLHLVLPVVITAVFLVYYKYAGYHIIPDVRLFFIILQICFPVFAGIAVSVLINLDRNISNIQNSLGLTETRKGVYLGKLFFLMFLCALSMILYELCFYVGVRFFLGISIMDYTSYLVMFLIFLFGNIFLYLLHIFIAFRLGAGISVFTGIAGTISAGYFENAIGDQIWPFIPWEWGVRFLKKLFGFSNIPVFSGIISLIIITLAVLVLSVLWFDRWEGNIVQE